MSDFFKAVPNLQYYKYSWRTLTEVLEHLDPSSKYVNTPLQGTDAFQRQLKLNHIFVSGPNTMTLGAFLKDETSIFLLPEFIRRTLLSVKRDRLNMLVANTSLMHSSSTSPDTPTQYATFLPEADMGAVRFFASSLEPFLLDPQMPLISFTSHMVSVGVSHTNMIFRALLKEISAIAGTSFEPSLHIGEGLLYELSSIFSAGIFNTIIAHPKLLGSPDMHSELQFWQNSNNIVVPDHTLPDDEFIIMDRNIGIEMRMQDWLFVIPEPIIAYNFKDANVLSSIYFRPVTPGAIQRVKI